VLQASPVDARRTAAEDTPADGPLAGEVRDGDTDHGGCMEGRLQRNPDGANGLEGGSTDPLKPGCRRRRSSCRGIVAADWPGQSRRRFGLSAADLARRRRRSSRSSSPEAGSTAVRAPTWSRTETRKRQEGSMRTLAVRRCAPVSPLIHWRGNVFRPRRPRRPWHRSRQGRDASDPPRRGLGTGSRPGVLAHPPPPIPRGR